jgi:hypothetical protein
VIARQAVNAEIWLAVVRGVSAAAPVAAALMDSRSGKNILMISPVTANLAAFRSVTTSCDTNATPLG